MTQYEDTLNFAAKIEWIEGTTMMYRDRKFFEEIETKTLAPYAVKNSESKGRAYDEPKHPYRTPFERDRERIIHSSAWRRLEYKTQVFVNHEGDHFRTRMTHSLEVATVSRVIARALGLNTELAEAIGFAHDLGHTPFGHSGEGTLNRLLKNFGGFEHNRQSLKMVETLEIKYPDFPGLNLTYETREGIVKHASRYDSPQRDLFMDVDKLPSLEAQVINIADEIAYQSHDVDDGLYSGLIDIDALTENVPLINELLDKVKTGHPDLKGEMLRHTLVRELLNYMVTDCIETSAAIIEKHSPKSVEDVINSSVQMINLSKELQEQNHKLGHFLYENLYRHYRVIRMATRADRVITTLFEMYLKEPNQLPDTTRKRLGTEPTEIIVGDYIAGMTDRYALLNYRQLFDPSMRFL